jgi:hypothetical protein
MPFTTMFRTARRLFQGQVLYSCCIQRLSAADSVNRSFSRTVNKRAGLRLAKATRAARRSLAAPFFETEGSLSGIIF